MQYFFCNKKKKTSEKLKNELKIVQKREKFYKKNSKRKKIKLSKNVVEAFIYVM